MSTDLKDLKKLTKCNMIFIDACSSISIKYCIITTYNNNSIMNLMKILNVGSLIYKERKSFFSVHDQNENNVSLVKGRVRNCSETDKAGFCKL